jgi:hypothetical protein
VLSSAQEQLDSKTQAFYRRALSALADACVDFLGGGAYALARYTGIARHTKDFDIFVRERDLDAALAALAAIGCRTEVTFPHWLGKALLDDELIDVIYSSGNGIVRVDDEWFEHAVADEVLGLPALLCPAEEMIWSKAFIMERERFDGADVIHLLQARSAELDWPRLLRRFAWHWRVLYTHLVLFGFIYPAERDKIPREVMDELGCRLERELRTAPAAGRSCQGTLLSRAQFLVDIERWGYDDARRDDPNVRMTDAHIAQWTDAIALKDRTYGCQGNRTAGGGG